jgi:hypothetical protein
LGEPQATGALDVALKEINKKSDIQLELEFTGGELIGRYRA